MSNHTDYDADFELGLDIEAELTGIRGPRDKAMPKSPEPEPEKEVVKEAAVPDTHDRNAALDRGGAANKESNTPSENDSNASLNQDGQIVQPEGFEVSQSQQERPGESEAPLPIESAMKIDWRAFKPIPGLFDHVGGERPVRLNTRIKRSQVSGIPEPLLAHIQKQLMDRHVGAVVHFPWGEFEIQESNKVFTTKSSLIRYLLFDGLRDLEGSHVQYAKQWLALQYPAFDTGFHPDTHLKPTSDELDIYALLYVAFLYETDETDFNKPVKGATEADFQTAEQLSMINIGMNRVLEKLMQQETRQEKETERAQTVQTLLLLDRMGLLKGGLPRDVEALAGILEQSRHTLRKTDQVLDQHIESEKERANTLARQQRMLDRQQRMKR